MPFKVVVVLSLGILLFTGSCANKTWCNKWEDRSTLETDLEHCNCGVGLLTAVLPIGQDECMRKFGWYRCDKNVNKKAGGKKASQ